MIFFPEKIRQDTVRVCGESFHGYTNYFQIVTLIFKPYFQTLESFAKPGFFIVITKCHWVFIFLQHLAELFTSLHAESVYCSD